MMRRVRANTKIGGTLYRTAGKAKNLRKVTTAAAAPPEEHTHHTYHSYSEEETVAFADWINYSLGDDAELKDKLPINTDTPDGADKLFSKVCGGAD